MLFKDLRQLIILIFIILIIVSITEAIRQLMIKRIGRKGLLSYNVYLSLNFLCIDLVTQAIIFLIFDWYISVIAWILSVPLYLLIYTFLYKTNYSANRYEITTRELGKEKQNDTKPQTKSSLLGNSFENKDSNYRSFFFHTAVLNPKSCICWFYVHLSAPALIWINILLQQTGLLPSLILPNTLVSIFYDIICSYGFCSIVYWLGYLLYPMSIRYENWRHWYHIIYFVFYAIWWFFFILIEAHMFN